MVNIEKEACPEKKDFLWRKKKIFWVFFFIENRQKILEKVHTQFSFIVLVLVFTPTWPPEHHSRCQCRCS